MREPEARDCKAAKEGQLARMHTSWPPSHSLLPQIETHDNGQGGIFTKDATVSVPGDSAAAARESAGIIVDAASTITAIAGDDAVAEREGAGSVDAGTPGKLGQCCVVGIS